MARTQYTVTFPAAKAGDEVTWPNTVKIYPDASTSRPLGNGYIEVAAGSFTGWSDAASVTFTRAGTSDSVTVTTGSPTGTGAAVPTAASSSPGTYNVKDTTYGAVGNGTADDTAAIQAAIDAAFAAGGGDVYLPAGTYKVSQSAQDNTTCVIVKEKVTLRGANFGAQIKAANALPAAVTSIVSTPVNTDQAFVKDFSIHGNKAGQTQVQHGLVLQGWGANYTVNPYNQGAGDGSGGLSMVDHVLVLFCSGKGIYTTNLAGEAKIAHCWVYGCAGISYDICNDSMVDSCTSGSSGDISFNLATDCVSTGCKAYTWNGQAAFVLADGVRVTGAQCEQPVNSDLGVVFNGANSTFEGSFTLFGGSAFYFGPNAKSCKAVGVGNTTSSVAFYDAGAAGNRVEFSNNSATAAPAGGFTLGQAGNTFTGFATEATQAVAYAATITPDPLLGSSIVVGTLTGAITVANPARWFAGARMRFVFTQDGTGSRAVTWGSSYAVSATAVSGTAGAVSVVEFICPDGHSWVQVGAAGLTALGAHLRLWDSGVRPTAAYGQPPRLMVAHSGQGWVPLPNSNWSSDGTGLYPFTNDAFKDFVLADVGVADGTYQQTIVTAGTTQAGCALRASTNGNTCLLLTSTALFTLNGTIYTQVGGNFSTPFASGDVMAVVLAGTSITVKRNGSSVLATTSSFNQTNTYMGPAGRSLSTRITNVSFVG